MAEPHTTKSFAWDGLEFPIPREWDLSSYTTRRRVVYLTLEDTTAVRLEVDWTAAGGRRQADLISKHHGRYADMLHTSALSVEAVSDVPDHWVMFLYNMPESSRLITALHVGDPFPIFVFARFHAVNCSRREILRDARTAINGFQYHDHGAIPWRIYDTAWRVPRRFRLVETSFLAGRKMMIFEHRLRRLYLWRLSLIDRLLKERTTAEVVADFLNRFKGLPGVKFEATGDNTVGVRHYRWYPLGHYEEVGRGCFAYTVRFAVNPADNAMTIAVFHHRRASDIQWLDGLELFDQPVTSQR